MDRPTQMLVCLHMKEKWTDQHKCISVGLSVHHFFFFSKWTDQHKCISVGLSTHEEKNGQTNTNVLVLVCLYIIFFLFFLNGQTNTNVLVLVCLHMKEKWTDQHKCISVGLCGHHFFFNTNVLVLVFLSKWTDQHKCISVGLSVHHFFFFF